jgi:hypothetical protein
MNNLALSLKKPVPLTLILGIFGGTGLILTDALTTYGPAIFIPYAALVIASFVALRLADLPNLVQRFSTVFVGFMLATIILSIFITTEEGTLAKIPVWGYIWSLGFMAIIGGSLSLNAAYLANNGFKPVSITFVVLLLAGLAIFIVLFIIRIIGIGIIGTGTIAKFLGPGSFQIGFLAMIVGSLGLNAVALLGIGRKYESIERYI